ncbi:hypothetical protein DdX_10449 [Ditylenchus destructor]|uniref:Uncharacterized protein n=1 Tax=Ditylenchus destructor TaxID=166010 RepID=A0AAD4N1R6_9BILA|nr:hypothetical protein DdX_10449 [Ditylenchus destructor]
MLSALGLCSDVWRDILAFYNRIDLIRILPTARQIRDFIGYEFSAEPYLIVGKVTSFNGTEWLVPSEDMTRYLATNLPTDILAAHKFIRSRQTNLDINSFNLPLPSFSHIWQGQKLLINFEGIQEPIPELPQAFVTVIGTCRELMIHTLCEFKLFPCLGMLLQAAQFNKIGVYDTLYEGSIDLNAEIVADFLLKVPNCDDISSSVWSISNVLSIFTDDACAAHGSWQGIIKETRERFLQSIVKHYLFLEWDTNELGPTIRTFEYDVIVQNKHTGQHLRLTVVHGYTLRLTSIENELAPHELEELQQFVNY